MKINPMVVRMLRDKAFAAGLGIVSLTLIVAVFAGQLVPYDPGQIAPRDRLSPPFDTSSSSGFHLLGTDGIGRDLLSRIMMGVRTSIVIAVLSIAVAVFLGASIGILAGLSYPEFLDSMLMRLTDIQMGFPFVLLAIIILSMIRPSILTITLVLSLSAWPAYARVIRSGIIVEKEMDYVAAAKVMGASRLRIAFMYLGKNIIPAIIPVAPMDLASVVIAESLLSFMNLGVQPPGISLGSIMADGWSYINTQWWITAMPGVAIFILVMGLNLMADGMQSASAKRQVK